MSRLENIGRRIFNFLIRHRKITNCLLEVSDVRNRDPILWAWVQREMEEKKEVKEWTK